MCGITGFIDFKKKSSLEELEAMNKTMHHRGPDGNGHKLFNEENCNIGIAQNRLSIIDLSENGKQPMQYKNYFISFNGEIYNFNEIKNELKALGHVFISKSDTEVVLHAYEEWGNNAVEKFIGMFAFVIYNQLAKTITCVRDRAGVKPFFYYYNNDVFLFASELKAFHKNPNFKKEINTNALAAYMQFGYVPTPNCIFKHTYKLKPGSILDFNVIKKTYTSTTYWDVNDFYKKPKLSINFEEAKIETEKIITKACNYRMVSDVPVGVFLSGGYDSTLVTALLQKNREDKLKTFTIGFDSKELNEAIYAKEVAKHLGTDHTEYICTIKEALNIVPTLPYFYDEPFADSSAIPTMLVSKVAKQKVTVALSADAGDEIFAGYNRYEFAEKYAGKLQKTPAFLRNTIANVLNVIPANKIPFVGKKELFNARYNKLKAIIKNPSGNQFLLSVVSKFSDSQLNSLVNGNVKLQDSFFYDNINSNNLLDTMMAMDYKTYLQDDILQKVDRAGMSVSLEGREPLLDQNIIEWAARLPNEYKYKNGSKKHIIKEIVHQYVPKQIMDRPKMGFSIPISNWLQNELKPTVNDFINEASLKNHNLLNIGYTLGILDDFYKGKTENAEKIWYILMFQMWYKQWM